ncbi:MAG: lysophospholipid acyltransferase family protein [Gemmatimonadaceae bacterium]
MTSLPPNLPRRRTPIMQKIGVLGMRLFGWRLEGELPNVAKAVIIVAPHTSNWDFFMGLFADLALDLKASWLGKHSIFVWPVKGLLLSLGGVPIQRGSNKNYVDQLVEEFATRDALVLAIAPEGTRKRVTQWRTGFYHIARGAQVPIVMVGLDYARKVVALGPVFNPTGDVDADLAALKAHFTQYTARFPDQY